MGSFIIGAVVVFLLFFGAAGLESGGEALARGERHSKVVAGRLLGAICILLAVALVAWA